ncbi:hypothetical protein ACQP04_01120 [Pseudonocardia halophobica]|uniref:hypothetical protein n=1 Tax=Pseudonocardia halophobica TaxID=29401 RepID=UPI003D8DE543
MITPCSPETTDRTMTTDARIRRALTNCSKGEAGRLTLPPDVRGLDLDTLDDVVGCGGTRRPRTARCCWSRAPTSRSR